MSKLIKDLERIVDEDQQRLRDHFAGLAMQVIMMSKDRYCNNTEYVAENAYMFADAMLKYRKKVSNG